MRKTDLTPEVQKRICDALKAGNTRRASAIYGGIAERTFYNWMERGTNPRMTKEANPYKEDEPYVQFVQAVTRAEAECEVWHVANIKKQADHDWRASVEWLKRRKSEDWTEKSTTTNNNVNIDLNDCTDDELRRIAAGEDIIAVLASTRGGNTGAAA